MKKKLAKLYMFLTVKTPIMSFGIVLLFFIIFFVVSANLFVTEYTIQSAVLEDSFVVTKYHSGVAEGSRVYFYFDKDERVYDGISTEVITEEDNMRIKIEMKEVPKENGEGFIEIPVGKRSILSQIFKGSQNE